MVARIKIKNALDSNFYYNENKVKQGVAECLMAANYPKDLPELSHGQRLKMLQKIASLNEDIKVNSVHISLNFDPSENFSGDKLKEIASLYMEKIGFGQQPYLVYQHFDAGHPHIHILSVKVDMTGRGIDTHYIGARKSEPARKEMEQVFKLVRAEDMKQKPFELKPVNAAKIIYGKSETRRAIANVLEVVLKPYKYTSLTELNAILRQYNVMADRCRETSRVFQHHGLLYRVLDENGKAVGVPIKASSFYNKPTLSFLEERFRLNEEERQPLKRRARNAIDLYFINQQNPSMEGMIQVLSKDGIHTVLRQNDKGQLYGITYVDHVNKVVFNGSGLGKAYSAKMIQERCKVPLQKMAVNNTAANSIITPRRNEVSTGVIAGDGVLEQSDLKRFSEILFKSEQVYEPVPYQLKKTRKKKKKRNRLSNHN